MWRASRSTAKRFSWAAATSREQRGKMSSQYLINMYVNDGGEDAAWEIHNNWKRECHESVSDAATKSQPQECLSPRQTSLQVSCAAPACIPGLCVYVNRSGARSSARASLFWRLWGWASLDTTAELPKPLWKREAGNRSVNFSRSWRRSALNCLKRSRLERCRHPLPTIS